MDNYLKTLIAAACLVVIAGGGYYGWSEYQKASARSAAVQANDRVRAELFEWAGAKPGEITKVMTYCNDMASSLKPGDDAPLTRRLVRNCRSLGLL